jgi:hypothetical protein
MAKEYEKFKAEWTVIKKEVETALEEIKANAQHVGQTSGIIQEGTKEIGKRVQELKDQGRQGDELKDFIADPEVKKMSDGVDDFLESLERELKQIETKHKGPWVKTKERFWALRKELEAEIKTRKKAVSTKVGLGNKSLPNMEALLKEIDKYKNAGFTTFDAFVPETIAQHRKETGFNIQDEIRKAKNVRLSEYQQMMMQQGLNVRHMGTNFGKAKTLYQGLTKALQEAEDAKRERKGNELGETQKAAEELYKQLVEIAAPYEQAPKDQWVRTQYQASKDRAKIESGIKSFGEMKEKADELMVKIKDVKLG